MGPILVIPSLSVIFAKTSFMIGAFPEPIANPGEVFDACDIRYYTNALATILHLGPDFFMMVLGPLRFMRGVSKKHNKLHRISGRIFVLCVIIGSFSSIDDVQVGFFSFLVNKGNFNFELDLSRIEHLMPQSQLNDVIVLDASQDGHKDLYFQQKISSKINAPIKISGAIYFNDGNGYFENSNLLGLPDFEGFENGLSAKGMITLDDVDSDGKLDIIKTDAWMRHSITEDIVEKRTHIYFKD